MPLDYRIFLKVLFLPPASPLVVGVVGLVLWARRPRLAFGLCAVSILSLWVLSTPVVSDALAHASETYGPLDPTHLTPLAAQAQAIVILGGGVRRNAPELGGVDAPGVHADLRMIEGARVARATHLPILVSGSAREAAAMRRLMQEDLQLPVRWVEGASSTTHENALFTARLLQREDIHRIILVTSSMHMRRAVGEFVAAGFEVTPAPAEMWTHDERGPLAFVPAVGALERSHTAIYEWLGRLVQKR